MLKVSVIVPVYNAELYIDECLQTLCNQTMSANDYEIIVVDDGSSDNSLEIIRSVEKSNNNITVVVQNNQGASVARNTGLDMARGRYISFVDADDWVESHMLETLYNEAEQNEADMIFFNIIKNENETMPAYMVSGMYSGEKLKQEIYPRLISTINENSYGKTLRGATWCKFLKKTLIDENFIRYDKRLIYNEDALFSIQATLASKRYVYLGDSYLYHNRVSSESITKRYIDGLWDRQKIMVNVLDDINGLSEFDFTLQIDKKMLDIAIYSVENEIKRKNKKLFYKRILEIRHIIADKDLQNRIKNLPVKQLKKIDRLYFYCFKFRLAVATYFVAKHRYRNNKFF